MTDLSASAPVRRAPMPAWPLTVVGAWNVTPRMRRVRFTGEVGDGFVWRPGQDLVLALPFAGGEARRHYTIRSFDPEEQTFDIDFALHGDSPATLWARAAMLGDQILAQGPRGRTVVNAAADWHLFDGDETGLPAIFAMLESLPAAAKATAILEVRDAHERQRPETKANVALEWFHREGPALASSPALIDRLALFAPPRGVGHAYVVGETSTVRAIRQGLIARGFSRDQICAEGYWRPGRIGGHDHVFDAMDVVGRVAGLAGGKVSGERQPNA
jgi:NADPH-dependent ferric siderophore reductase